MTPEEERNSATVDLWIDTYNDDVVRMVEECYAADCEMEFQSNGLVVRGREQLHTLEQSVAAAYPDRRVTLRRKIVSGDVVVAEIVIATTVNGKTRTANSCVVMTFRDGEIISDHTYADLTSFSAKKASAT